MKPVQLELTNFGPYRKEIINFEDLDQAPVFLISGDTGAGKSTIFDAMTMALFNVTTGERKPEETRSTFATLEDELTKIVFYFRHGSQLYKIERVPGQERKAARGKGSTSQKAEAHFAIVDQIGGVELEVLASKPVDVATEVNSLLQLNAEQFKQIILLPQNEFRKFLISNTADKLPILKNIFGTRLFEDFANRVEDKYRQSRVENEKYSNQLSGHYDSQIWSEEERLEFGQTDESYKIELAGKFVSNYKEKADISDKSRIQAKDDLKSAQMELDKAKQLSENFQELNTVNINFENEIINQKDKYKYYIDKKNQQDFLDDIRDTIRDLDHSQNEIDKYGKLLESNKDKLSETEKNTHLLEIELKEHLSHESEIKLFEENLDEWKELRNTANQVIAYESEIISYSDELKKYEVQKNSKSELLETKIKDKKKLEIGAISQEEVTKNVAAYDKAKFIIDKNIAPLLKEVSTLEKRIISLCGEQAESKKKLESDRYRYKDYLSELESVKENRRELMVAQLREELVDGQECLVCGSLEHPVTHNHDGIQANESELKDSMEKVEALQQQVGSLEQDLKNQEESLSQNETRKNEIQLEIDNKKTDINNNYDEIKNLFDGFPSIYDESLVNQSLIEFKNSIDELKSIFEKQSLALAELTDEITNEEHILLNLQNEIDTKVALKDSAVGKLSIINTEYPELKDVSYYTDKIEITSKKIRDYSSKKEELQGKFANLQSEVRSLKVIVESNESHLKENQDINDLASAKVKGKLTAPSALTSDENILREWISETEVYGQAIAFINTYKERERTLTERREKLLESLSDKEIPDLDSFVEKYERSQAKYDNASQEFTKAETNYNNAKATLEEIKKISEKQGIHLKTFQELSDLNSVVKGKTGDKLKLETYVVQEYLNQVLDQANKRYIGKLTNGRYQFVLSNAQRDGKRSDSGLDIDVFDFTTGTTRSTKTLSGGETFIAALSIALSLSEIVQNTTNGIVIDALFVDEGFGSLDKETLEKAMTALEQIGENRMVGVISHVEDMKERIAQQLIISKSGDGSSTISMIDRN
ncbi:hypothetical protein BG262_06290 [Floricoccus penangensis]|uniref:Nuclease SbcCD subunit C n=1 Tax=Floricoccus penangensis TaxID=1859475 RepID=A0A9Q5NYZ6_9LACT|nr:SMC family ATPase [Floricoccus penangensis]OFI46090.1 hypothetical protein BG262_06290 [Floricoccus penangensis]